MVNEDEVGIARYANSLPGFTGILKHRCVQCCEGGCSACAAAAAGGECKGPTPPAAAAAARLPSHSLSLLL